MAKEIYNSCKSNKEIYIVHGANHADNYKKDPEGYENVIVQFVGEHSGRRLSGVRPHKEKINISKECINKTKER